MRTLKQIKQEEGVNSLKAIHIQYEETKAELAKAERTTEKLKNNEHPTPSRSSRRLPVC